LGGLGYELGGGGFKKDMNWGGLKIQFKPPQFQKAICTHAGENTLNESGIAYNSI